MKDAETLSLHAGSRRPRIEGAIATPIFQSSTFEYHGQGYHDVGYLRLSNSPNHDVLARRIAALEGTESALVTASGMAAISSTLLSLLSTGDHVLVQDCLYGGTTGLFQNEFRRLGITHTPIDVQRPQEWAAAIQPTTRAIYVETLTNPLVQLADLDAVVALAREHGFVSLIDNTFASPINFRPAERGFDLVLESCTKYMSGHNDITAGSVAGSSDAVRQVKLAVDHLGGSLDPHACFLLERGLKTLALRVRHQNVNAQRIAEYLEKHPAIKSVNYPGLPSHPQHERATRFLSGFGGMMAFEVRGGVEAAEAFLQALAIPAVAPSLGGAESLIVRPAAAVHSGLPPEEREKSGITDSLIRFSVGLESADDLIEDLEAALGRVPVAAMT